MSGKLTRRAVLKSTMLAAIAQPYLGHVGRAASVNEEVRLAAVGVGGKGWNDLVGAADHCRVVAFCDVDTGINRRGGFGAAAERWPQARRYTDFRKLIEQEHGRIDAMTVSTPDHMHAPVSMMALHHGIAVYTQKPLTRTVEEARALSEAARTAGVATQMGNQHHSGRGYRMLVEIIRGGGIGKVRAAHAWSDRPIWPQGHDRPATSDSVPNDFNWDLWLGVAPERPFVDQLYHPFKWRGWYDFGAGALGDMGCHIIDPVVWALELGTPLSVSYSGPPPNPETFPKHEVLTYRFNGTAHTAEDIFEMLWYDGNQQPSVEGSHLPAGTQLPNNGVMFIGDSATILCPHGGDPQVYPTAAAVEIHTPKLDPWNHYKIWVDAVRDGKQANSHFGYAGPLTETVLLGVIASRVGAGQLDWDSERMQFSNSPLANEFIRQPYRQGWEIPGLG